MFYTSPSFNFSLKILRFFYVVQRGDPPLEISHEKTTWESCKRALAKPFNGMVLMLLIQASLPICKQILLLNVHLFN